MSSQDFQGFDHFLRGMHPAMNPATTLQGEHWRIGLITESLIRLEWSDSGEFEDRATLMAVDRAFLPSGAVDYTTGERDGMLVVETPALRLTYDRKPFSKEGLTIVVKGVPDSQFNTWHYGDEPKGNLGGTARTLDEADGAIPLGQGVISRDGWAVLDDSASNVFVTADADGNLPDGVVAYGGIGVAPRDHRETDIYFFGYGRRYREAVHDFQKLSGPAPLLPRYALGNWWSRYYRYSEEEYLDLMDRFKREGIPFTTSVIDMDWHLVDDVDPKYGSGWTGYTWNPKLFPDPKRFLDGLHERGLRTTVNIHPRDGIRAFEKPYAKAAATVGVDAEAQEPVEFDLTNPKFVQAYFDMHHDLEADGIDFWWIDWQQGGVTRQPGLDPLWVLNHMHYCDSARDGRWPLTFSRFAGPGSQRYPVGFSGDTVITWKSLKFQPYFTSTASNIGYGWWSHDIGGHMFGYRDEELEARWYQLGAFSPINRLHSSCSPFSGKEPWNFRPEIHAIMDDALRLRHRMIPYLHTMNWRASRTGLPLVEPMYWGSPDIDAAYHVPNEYMFGTELLAAPITEPMDKSSRRGKADVWLPQGDWFDFFTGRRYSASSPNGRRMTVWRPLDGIPVFAKAGGIVPMQPLSEGDSINSVDNPQHLEIIVFPGADGDFTLMEDSGHYSRQITPATTAITYRWRKDGATSALTVSPAQGDVHALPARRTWDFLFRGITDSDISVQADGASVDSDRRYDAETLTLQVTVADVSTRSEIRVTIGDTTMAADPRMEDVFDILRHAEMRYLTKEQAYAAIAENGIDALATMDSLEHVSGPDMEDCSDSHMPSAVRQALTEVLLRS